MPQSHLQSKHPTTLRQMVLAHYLSEVLAFPSYASCHPPDTAAWIARSPPGCGRRRPRSWPGWSLPRPWSPPGCLPEVVRHSREPPVRPVGPISRPRRSAKPGARHWSRNIDSPRARSGTGLGSERPAPGGPGRGAVMVWIRHQGAPGSRRQGPCRSRSGGGQIKAEAAARKVQPLGGWPPRPGLLAHPPRSTTPAAVPAGRRRPLPASPSSSAWAGCWPCAKRA